MANRLFEVGRNEFAKGLVHWSTTGTPDTFKVFGVTAAAAVDTTAMDYLDDIVTAGGGATCLVGSSGLNTIAKAPTLNLIEPVAGVCDAADTTFVAVNATCSPITQLVIFKEGSTRTNSLLIALFDTATGLPVTPNGGDIIITWDSGANKIFKL